MEYQIKEVKIELFTQKSTEGRFSIPTEIINLLKIGANKKFKLIIKKNGKKAFNDLTNLKSGILKTV